MDALLNPFASFASAIFVWAVVCFGRWLASGGRLPLRGRRGSASACGAAGFAGQAFYQPDAGRVLEALFEQAELRDEEGEGDPPGSQPVRPRMRS